MTTMTDMDAQTLNSDAQYITLIHKKCGTQIHIYPSPHLSSSLIVLSHSLLLRMKEGTCTHNHAIDIK